MELQPFKIPSSQILFANLALATRLQCSPTKLLIIFALGPGQYPDNQYRACAISCTTYVRMYMCNIHIDIHMIYCSNIYIYSIYIYIYSIYIHCIYIYCYMFMVVSDRSIHNPCLLQIPISLAKSRSCRVTIHRNPHFRERSPHKMALYHCIPIICQFNTKQHVPKSSN